MKPGSVDVYLDVIFRRLASYVYLNDVILFKIDYTCMLILVFPFDSV
jgi:hypothetical protein